MRHHRENGWDYRGRAIYHFTLPVEERYPLFGTLDGESAETAFVRLNPYGRRVCQMLCGLAQFYAGKGFALKVLAQKVMPDHVHLVIQVLEPLPQSIGAVVRGFKSGCTKVYKEMYSSGENAAEVHRNEERNGERECTETEKKTPLKCTETKKGTPLKCTETKKGTPLKCTETKKETTRMDVKRQQRFPCNLLAFLRVGVVSGNRTRLIITSEYSMHLGSCGG